MDILLDEGVLSFDIIPNTGKNSRDKEVIRFTYERFSDHFVAQHILEKYVKDNDVATLFSEEQLIGKMLNEGKLYELGGIIEALGICIPEKFGHELIDCIPENINYSSWLFQQTFTEVVLWRSPDSFTENTLKLLNKTNNQYIINILLSLSTEPNHPWNAYLLNKHLFRMTLSKRDTFWSTYIAMSDREEDEEQPESILRTLIEWSLSTNLEEVEPERLKLTGITLTWLTTTSNRKVRDQATKSLARILSKIPNLISIFIKRFNNTNDPYLVERLYAAIYGAICHIDCENSIKEVAESVFEHVFKHGKPYPNILLRDYARGIMELAYYKNLLAPSITPDIFRPPYNSDWPLENPSKQEIDKLTGGHFTSSIRDSLIGFLGDEFPGDFGKYTMDCIHDWSPTSLSEPKPESAYEIHEKFANSLSEDLKALYLSYLETKTTTYRSFSDETKHWKKLKEKIEASLDDEQKEKFRWISGLDVDNRPATFSRKLAQRWVCKRAYELSQNSKSFEIFEFEKIYLQHFGKRLPLIERIGKKYQWIAFYELLARIADNVHWIDRGSSNVDDSIFHGPWQIHKRDIDPTFWLRKTGDVGYEQKDICWWQPYTFPFANGELEEQQSWLWDRTIIPPFTELFKRTNPSDAQPWLVLQGFALCNNEKSEISSQEGWFRINSCIVHKQDVPKLKQQVKGKYLSDPRLLSLNSNEHQGFLKEYPWHPCYQDFVDWTKPGDKSSPLANIEHLVPTSQYRWETGNTDQSIDQSISLYLPAKLLIKELGLVSQSEPGLWIDSNGNHAFIDPSVKNKGPSYALMKFDLLQPWLKKNELQLVWLVGGEKQLFDKMANKFYGRLVYNGMFVMNNDEIDGKIWFVEEKG